MTPEQRLLQIAVEAYSVLTVEQAKTVAKAMGIGVFELLDLCEPLKKQWDDLKEERANPPIFVADPEKMLSSGEAFDILDSTRTCAMGYNNDPEHSPWTIYCQTTFGDDRWFIEAGQPSALWEVDEKTAKYNLKDSIWDE